MKCAGGLGWVGEGGGATTEQGLFPSVSLSSLTAFYIGFGEVASCILKTNTQICKSTWKVILFNHWNQLTLRFIYWFFFIFFIVLLIYRARVLHVCACVRMCVCVRLLPFSYRQCNKSQTRNEYILAWQAIWKYHSEVGKSKSNQNVATYSFLSFSFCYTRNT